MRIELMLQVSEMQLNCLSYANETAAIGTDKHIIRLQTNTMQVTKLKHCTSTAMCFDHVIQFVKFLLHFSLL